MTQTSKNVQQRRDYRKRRNVEIDEMHRKMSKLPKHVELVARRCKSSKVSKHVKKRQTMLKIVETSCKRRKNVEIAEKTSNLSKDVANRRI